MALQFREPESNPLNNVNLPGVGCAYNPRAEKQGEDPWCSLTRWPSLMGGGGPGQ